MAVDKLTKKELLEDVSGKTGLDKSDVEKVLESYYETLVTSMEEGKKFTHKGFGTYQLRQTKERMGRNPATGEAIKIAAKKKVVFRPAKALKERLVG